MAIALGSCARDAGPEPASIVDDLEISVFADRSAACRSEGRCDEAARLDLVGSPRVVEVDYFDAERIGLRSAVPIQQSLDFVSNEFVVTATYAAEVVAVAPDRDPAVRFEFEVASLPRVGGEHLVTIWPADCAALSRGDRSARNGTFMNPSDAVSAGGPLLGRVGPSAVDRTRDSQRDSVEDAWSS